MHNENCSATNKSTVSEYVDLIITVLVSSYASQAERGGGGGFKEGLLFLLGAPRRGDAVGSVFGTWDERRKKKKEPENQRTRIQPHADRVVGVDMSHCARCGRLGKKKKNNVKPSTCLGHA